MYDAKISHRTNILNHKKENMRGLTFALFLVVLLDAQFLSFAQNNERPNILWITCEDISPYLGCYGCLEAQTPNLDRLAESGIRYTHAYANAPVCAVARSTILSGMYACAIGTHQMRSRIQLPPEIPAYPKILREAGYYCTNNSKKDYNSNYETDATLWDESSNKAHYKNRKAGQPFFAVFNNMVTHESQLDEKRIRQYVENKEIPILPRINPKNIVLPPYHPDLPEIREDWARLHDLITLMDSMSGDLLNELRAEGLDENTIVFFYSDHGGQLSRAKRYIYNVGTQVPMIVYLPPKWRHLSKINAGGTDDSFVSFVDLAKTVLSITGCNIPEKMQGRIFLGSAQEKAPEYVHFYRDRMAERYDFSRAVTDGRYYYIRNFFPHRPLGRDSRYGFQVQANWRAWEKYFEEGNCNEIQSQFFRVKSSFELFDTQTDPWHVSNIAIRPDLQSCIKEMDDEMDRWMIEIRDIGLIPEPMFHDLAGKGKRYETIYEYAQSKDYPVKEILEAAKISSMGEKTNLKQLLEFTGSKSPVIRFWGAYGLFLIRQNEPEIIFVLKAMVESDETACNRIMAAQALGIIDEKEYAFRSIMKEVNETNVGYVMLQALNAFQYSHTDDRLTLSDWEYFKKKKFVDGDAMNTLGYPARIIDDSIDLWPERRKVD